MINRISGVESPGGRRPAPPGFILPDRSDRSEQWKELRGRIEKYIGDHPVMSLAIGITVGVMLGCLIKRR